MPRPPLLPASIPAAGLKALSSELTRIGYTEEGLRERFGLGAIPAADYFAALGDPPLVLSRDGLSPLDWLIQLFLLGEPVPSAELGRLLSDEALEALTAVELVQRVGADLEASAAVLPHEGLYLLADFARPDRPADAVPFPDPATLAGARIMEPSFDDERSLAICLQGGTGLHPLLLKSRYNFETVLVHDELERPRQLTALAAALNGLQIEVTGEPPSGARVADLVTGSFTGILRCSRQWSARRPTLADEGRWNGAFAAAATLINDGGRAVLCHEIRRDPKEWFARKLQPILGGGAMDLVWIRVHGTGLYEAEKAALGVSVLRRREKDTSRSPLMHAGSLLGLPHATARGLALYLESRRLILDLGPKDILKLVPYRNARAVISMLYEVGPERTLVPGHLQIGPQKWPPQAMEVLKLCDNGNTLQQVADKGENFAQLALELVVDGAVYLRRPQ